MTQNIGVLCYVGMGFDILWVFLWDVKYYKKHNYIFHFTWDRCREEQFVEPVVRRCSNFMQYHSPCWQTCFVILLQWEKCFPHLPHFRKQERVCSPTMVVSESDFKHTLQQITPRNNHRMSELPTKQNLLSDTHCTEGQCQTPFGKNSSSSHPMSSWPN